MLDLVIRNGMLVDGTGSKRRHADIGVKDGRVVALGAVDERAGRSIDAEGRVVAPGFVDLHTHYDPHVMWDPAVTPSSLHGVTTVFGGNCGFGLAPMDEASLAYLLPMLARVEGMPLEALETGFDVTWSSFGEWLDRIDGTVGVNAGFLVGHSTIRRLVMGDAATERTATPAEVERMAQLLHVSLDEGAMGFSSSWGGGHTDHFGAPVPSRWAAPEELLTLCRAVRDHEGTTLGFIPPRGETFDEATYQLMTDMSLAAQRPLNWNLLRVAADEASRISTASRLGASDHAARAGARVVPLTLPEPLHMLINFFSGFLFDTLPGWSEIMFRPLPERVAAFADPTTRAELAAGAARGDQRVWNDWPRLRLMSVERPDLQHHVGRTMAELAAETGADPFDAMLDLVVADEGRPTFQAAVVGDDDESWQLRIEMARDPRVLVGGSDAGAHLDMLQTFACHTRFLATAVRERELLDLEEAIRLITDAPARFYGVRDRGRIEVGCHADVVVLDPDTVGPGTTEFRHDMPGGAGRMYSDPTGIGHVLVNGIETVTDGRPTGDVGGTVLRSGRDTTTVPLSV